MTSPSGKIALVTGALSGLGRSIALALGPRAGADVIVTDLLVEGMDIMIAFEESS